MHQSQRQNVATSMVGLKTRSHTQKSYLNNGEPQRTSWEPRRRRMAKPRDTARNMEEEEEEEW